MINSHETTFLYDLLNCFFFRFSTNQSVSDDKVEENKTSSETVNGNGRREIDFSKLTETGRIPTNARQKETYQKMIERVKEYHSNLDVAQYQGKERVDLFACYICFDIFMQPELLRSHYIEVS